MFPLQSSTGHGEPVGRSPFCLHHSCTTLSSCENRWKKFLGLAKSPKVIDDTSSFLSLKFPPLLRPSRSEVFDEADIKWIFTYLLFKTAHDTHFYFMDRVRGYIIRITELTNWMLFPKHANVCKTPLFDNIFPPRYHRRSIRRRKNKPNQSDQCCF